MVASCLVAAKPTPTLPCQSVTPPIASKSKIFTSKHLSRVHIAGCGACSVTSEPSYHLPFVETPHTASQSNLALVPSTSSQHGLSKWLTTPAHFSQKLLRAGVRWLRTSIRKQCLWLRRITHHVLSASMRFYRAHPVATFMVGTVLLQLLASS